MKCQQCKEREAGSVLLDYEQATLLCDSCLHEYEHMFGEIDTESYHLKTDIFLFIKRVDETLKYLNEMQTRYSDRYFAVKKLGEAWANTQPDPHDDALSDLPESVRIKRKLGQELLGVIQWDS